jgi:hypothetical protein
MKKSILTISILFSCLSIQAQFYLKGYAGYSLSTGDSRIEFYQILNDVMDGASANMKYGQGFNLGLSAGYSFSKNVALEITGNTQFFSGLNFSAEPDLSAVEGLDNWSWTISGNPGKTQTANRIIQWAPQIVFSSNPCGDWVFYLKGGPDFLYAKTVIRETRNKLQYPSVFPALILMTDRYRKMQHSGGINVGTQFSTGAEYSLKENIRLFAEITIINVRYNFEKYKYLRYEVDGVDEMSHLDNVSGERDNKVNLNHIGLNVGLKFTF